MLYLLTFADVKGVGPEVWNAWKASLLGELYVKTLTVLEEFEKGEFERPDLKAAVRRVQVRVRRDLAKDHALDRVNRFLDAMPDRYFLSVSEADMPAQFALMEQFTGKGAVSFVEHFPERYCSSLVVCTQDRPGLFAAITGVLTALSLNILNARIFTSSDGRILDIFRISHAGRPEVAMADTRWSKFRDHLNDVLAGEIDVARLVGCIAEGACYCKNACPRYRRLFRSTTKPQNSLILSKFSPMIGSACCSTSLTSCTSSACRSMSRRFPPTSIRWRMFFTSRTRAASR